VAITRYQLPYFIERNVEQALTLDVYDDAGTQETATVARLTLYQGSKVVVDNVAATGLGPPATYTLPAATTVNESLSDDWLAVWTLTIDGAAREYRREAYLVRDIVYPTITDTDLTDRHPELTALRSSGYENERTAAWAFINRKLIAQGRRPNLIISSWALLDPHVYKTLELVFRGFHASTGDGRYADMEQRYRDLFDEAWASTEFRYDEDEDGTIGGDDERSSAESVVWLNRPNRGRRLLT